VLERGNPSARETVIDIVVKGDLCIGCGLCAAVCPRNSLKMRWSGQGELIPNMTGPCSGNCDLCLKVCPSFEHDLDQSTAADDDFGSVPGILTRPETGCYLGCYAGYSLFDNQRMQGASGGMVTWFLKTLLDRGLVDGVVCVVPDESPGTDRLFRFSILRSVSELRAAAKSKYHPVEISEVLRTILAEKEDGKFAVVGLPCLLYGLKLAMSQIPKLRRRIAYRLSLVCGQLPNRYYTECLALEAGVPVGSIHTIDYRVKEGTARAGNFAFHACDASGVSGRPIYWNGLPNYLWQNSFFIHNACNYCDDVFGETADIAFMDAWLPEYESDPRGHSLIIARTCDVKEILEAGIKNGGCHLDPISIEKIVQSQNRVIFKKKHLLKANLYRAGRLNRWAPKKRVAADKIVYCLYYWAVNKTAMVINESKRLWSRYRNTPDTREFWRAMKPVLLLMNLFKCLQKGVIILNELFDRVCNIHKCSSNKGRKHDR
jgi:coenzyme F420-reducing hydrogenase beta subunit